MQEQTSHSIKILGPYLQEISFLVSAVDNDIPIPKMLPDPHHGNPPHDNEIQDNALANP